MGAKDLFVLAYALSSKSTLCCIPGATENFYDIGAALGEHKTALEEYVYCLYKFLTRNESAS